MTSFFWILGAVVGCAGSCDDRTEVVTETISVTTDEFVAADVDEDGEWDSTECLVMCDARSSMNVTGCAVAEFNPDNGRYDLECTGEVTYSCSVE